MREQNGRREINLSLLAEGMPGLTSAWGGVIAEAASVCLEDQGHGIVVELRVEGHFEAAFDVERLEVGSQMRSSHGDRNKATENGAYGISFLVLRSLTGMTVLYQARGDSCFDYFLAREDEALFQAFARLEVSGIRRGREREIRARMRQKRRQTQNLREGEPVLVAVVEFSRPLLRLEAS